MRRRLRRVVLVGGAATAVLFLLPLMALAGIISSGEQAGPAARPSSVPGIPQALLEAYLRAAETITALSPHCQGMRWQILAGIGQIESNQLSGRDIAGNGDVTPLVIGPQLSIRDTDGGRWDYDHSFDHAVGPTQFLPSTWVDFGQDGNDDGDKNPHNVYDATLASAVYLCGDPARNLNDRDQLSEAVFTYNHSHTYVSDVLGWIDTFDAMPAGPAGPPGEGAQGAVAAAMAMAGTRYSWGGGGPTGPTTGICTPGPAANDCHVVGFDCSGLMQYAYARVGISLPRVSRDQFLVGERIPRSAGVAALVPGDLVFFALNPQTGAGVHHVGMYIGDGQMINAPYSGTVVRVDTIDLAEYAGASRVA